MTQIETSRRRRSRTVAGTVAWLGFSWVALILVTGGFDTHLFGLPFTAHDTRRPLLWSALALSLFMLIGGDDLVVRRTQSGARAVWRALVRSWRGGTWIAVAWRLDWVAALALSVTMVATGVLQGAKGGGGADSYGYVSEADLLLSGHVSISQTWVKELPWSYAKDVTVPLGYRTAPDHWLITPPVPHDARDPWAIVPTYAPGLPLLMAGAKILAGQGGMFWIVPLAGGLLVLATCGIGRRLGSTGAGLIGAWLVASSPNVLQMVQLPMSDVPVAAAWAMLYWALLGSTVASGVGAAIAGMIAILIRPNLFFMSGAAMLLVAQQIWVTTGAERRRMMFRGALVATGLGAGIVAAASINWAMNASPFVSGYGTLSDVMKWVHVGPNFVNYTQSFVKVHSVFALAGIAALFLPFRWLWPGVRHRNVLLCLGVFVAGLWLEYMFWGVFEDELYLRFLLSSWPFIMLGVGRTMLVPATFGPAWFKGTMTLAAVIVAALWGLPSFLIGLQGGQREGESLYATAAYHTGQATPQNSVIFTVQHSGSVRYYGGRMTLRYDTFPPDEIDRGLTWLSEHGVHPYALLEDWEIAMFEGRFASQRAAALLSRPPILTFRSAALYDLAPNPDAVVTTTVIPMADAILDVLPPAPAPTLVFRQQ